MARNGSGTYSLYTPGNPVVTGTTISSTAFNNTMSDIATALTQSLAADGQTPVTANIPMNAHKLTGLAAGTTLGDALSYGQSGASVATFAATGNATVGGTLGVTGATTLSGGVAVTGDVTVSGTSNGKGLSLVVYKTATTSRSSTAVYADDPHLVLALTVGTWAISCWMPFWATTSGAGGLKAKLVYSGTITAGTYSQNGYVNGAAATGSVGDIPTGAQILSTAPISVGTAPVDWVLSTGYVTVSTTGNLSLQWAQNTSNGNAANVAIGAWLSATKLA